PAKTGPRNPLHRSPPVHDSGKVWIPAYALGCQGKVEGWSFWKLAAEFCQQKPLPGLEPGIHVLTQYWKRRRGWPGRARPRGFLLVARRRGSETGFDSPDSPALTRERRSNLVGDHCGDLKSYLPGSCRMRSALGGSDKTTHHRMPVVMPQAGDAAPG